MAMQALATSTPASVTAETLLDRFRSYVARGWTPYLAADQAVRDLCHEGHQDVLISEVLPALLFKRWEQEDRPARSLAERESISQGMREAGQRRVDPRVLKRSSSLMESLFEVDGVWVRIGDMDRAACRRAASQQKAAALKRAHYARFFHAMAERLPGEGAVRQALQEAELTRIFEAATPGAGN